ncbi:hypothetical protein [Providencia sp. Me31A]|uniref:hypothetical protein n=1 Tax=Providencia sp. Me31A TaxID=3392637 RepID=UPI003D2A87DD
MALRLESIFFQNVGEHSINTSVIDVHISDNEAIPITDLSGDKLDLYENQNYQFTMIINKSESDVRKMSINEIEKIAFEQLKKNVSNL